MLCGVAAMIVMRACTCCSRVTPSMLRARQAAGSPPQACSRRHDLRRQVRHRAKALQ
jgi:hypothetical protein